MTTRSIREALQVQLLETQNLLTMVGNHPVMGPSLRYKEQDLQQQLKSIPIDQKEAKIILFFSGQPVYGSLGIDALFAGKVLNPFQNMVKTDFSQRIHGKVGGRGPVNNSEESQLFITALPRGSFGIEMTKLKNNNLYDEQQLADTLVHLTNLIEASAKSDEDFAVSLDDTAPRTIGSLKEFLKVISDEHAGIKIESGGVRCELSVEQARIAFNRVSATHTDEVDNRIEGTLKGILTESWRFDFVTADGKILTGRIDDDLTVEDVTNYLKSYFDKNCLATFHETKVVFKNGKERISYKLLNIAKAE